MSFNLGDLVADGRVPSLSAEAPRSIETITGEILELKKTAGESILSIGQRLIEAQSVLSHGEWLPWLTDQVEFSPRTAQRFMRLAKEWSNATALSHLGATKALTLLALPPEERDQFMAEVHMIDGEEKTVIDMSARQLEQAIKERDDARQAAATAEADAKVAEASRAKMEADLVAMTGLLESAKVEKDQAVQSVADLERQLAEIKAAPVDVAVMEVDQAALDNARAEGAAEIQLKLDKTKAAKETAEKKRQAAEEALAILQTKYDAAVRESKMAAISTDRDMATFEVLFNQAQEIANKMQGLLIKARGCENTEIATKLQKAMQALASAIGRAAE